MADYGYDILIGIIVGILLLFVILASLLDKFFPKNKISSKLDNFAAWIRDNIKI